MMMRLKADHIVEADPQPTPEQMLILQVLWRAHKDIEMVPNGALKTAHHKAKLDAIEWVMSDATTPYSFLWCLDSVYERIDTWVHSFRAHAREQIQ